MGPTAKGLVILAFIAVLVRLYRLDPSALYVTLGAAAAHGTWAAVMTLADEDQLAEVEAEMRRKHRKMAARGREGAKARMA